VARLDAEVKDVLSNFVCVRVVQANGMDLSVFQFDYNLTWAALFLNADKTLYGRYGTRENKQALSRISIQGFRKAAEAALALHKGYPGNKALLEGKKGPPPKARTPEGFPELSKYSPVLTPADANKGCMHCHMVQDAIQMIPRATQKAIPDEQLWLYPLPDWLGLTLDTKECATVQSVAPGSPAEKDGWKAGDRIATFGGQAVISPADVQWVLQQAKEPSKVKAEVERAGQKVSLDLTVAKGWRRSGDFSWRFFVHEAFYTGDMRVKPLAPDEKKPLGIAETALALKVTRVGWPVGPPPPSRKAGFQVDDVVVEVDRQKAAWTESDFVAYCAQKKIPGDKVEIGILRGGKPQKLVLPLQR
jgi:membrane-associated protease RseP (regulator of RpoE activity)